VCTFCPRRPADPLYHRSIGHVTLGRLVFLGIPFLSRFKGCLKFRAYRTEFIRVVASVLASFTYCSSPVMAPVPSSTINSSYAFDSSQAASLETLKVPFKVPASHSHPLDPLVPDEVSPTDRCFLGTCVFQPCSKENVCLRHCISIPVCQRPTRCMGTSSSCGRVLHTLSSFGLPGLGYVIGGAFIPDLTDARG
jgi:hypothetical protein